MLANEDGEITDVDFNFVARDELKQHMINAAALMQDQLTDAFKTDLSNAFRVYDDDNVGPQQRIPAG